MKKSYLMFNEILENPSVQKVIVLVVGFGVLLNGLLIILMSLSQQFIFHSFARETTFSLDLTLIVGITLIYFSNLLLRRKQTAWVLVLLVYAFYFGIRIEQIEQTISLVHRHRHVFNAFQGILLPSIIVVGLLLGRKAYKVKSDIRSFGSSLRLIFIILLVAFLYGVIGFKLMRYSDFHRNISFTEAIHRTIDQFNLTTNDRLIPYTRRARLLLDSITAISLAAIAYALLSLFQPLKARFGDQTHNITLAEELLARGHGSSEDFFKIWPHDKSYFFSKTRNSAIAYNVHRGIALVVGDPFGAVAEYKHLVKDFEEFCGLNDWTPSFIHTEPHYSPLYRDLGYTLQKIGEEAVVEIGHFNKNVENNKYFRNIKNRFDKNGYSTEVLSPPFDTETLKKLKSVSDDWLTLPGRTERGFMMGYFSYEYINKNNVLILKDKDGEIVAFINQVYSFDKDEANYDLLRHKKSAMSNSTDILLLNFIKFAHEKGFKRVNLGLCPLTGLDNSQANSTLIDSTLKFLYSNGDRFYSFTGLKRFKQKYEPEWSDRYVAYKNGIRGFTRAANALNVSMKPHRFYSSQRKNKKV